MFFLPAFAVFKILAVNWIDATPFLMTDDPMFLPFNVNVTLVPSDTFVKLTLYVPP